MASVQLQGTEEQVRSQVGTSTPRKSEFYQQGELWKRQRGMRHPKKHQPFCWMGEVCVCVCVCVGGGGGGGGY